MCIDENRLMGVTLENGCYRRHGPSPSYLYLKKNLEFVNHGYQLLYNKAHYRFEVTFFIWVLEDIALIGKWPLGNDCHCGKIHHWNHHDDVIKWKHFLRYRPFVRGIHRSPVNPQRPVTRSFDVSFDLCLNKRLSKQWWGWWFETPSRPLWRHRNDYGNAITWPPEYNFLSTASFFVFAWITLMDHKGIIWFD